MSDSTKTHVSLVIPRSLYERLDEMRWEKRAPSFVAMLRDLLKDSADRHDKERKKRQVEMVS